MSNIFHGNRNIAVSDHHPVFSSHLRAVNTCCIFIKVLTAQVIPWFGAYIGLRAYGYVTIVFAIIGAGGGLLEPESRVLRVTNEFLSGVYLIDSKRVMVPISIAQQMLQLDEAQLVDDDDETVIGVEPARATMVLVRAAEGYTPEVLRDAVSGAYSAFCDELVNDDSISAK